jgi:PBS lyase HEAT-like repeat
MIELWLVGAVVLAAPPPRDDQPHTIPFVAPGTKEGEAKALAPLERMTGAELTRLLKEDRYQDVPLDRVPYGPRMRYRAIQRLGELRHAPAAPELIRLLDYWYPAAGESWDVLSLNEQLTQDPAPRALVAIGPAAIPAIQEALKTETIDERKRDLERILTAIERQKPR